MTQNEYRSIAKAIKKQLDHIDTIQQDDSFDSQYVAGRYQGIQAVCYELADLFYKTSIAFYPESFLHACGLKVITINESWPDEDGGKRYE